MVLQHHNIPSWKHTIASKNRLIFPVILILHRSIFCFIDFLIFWRNIKIPVVFRACFLANFLIPHLYFSFQCNAVGNLGILFMKGYFLACFNFFFWNIYIFGGSEWPRHQISSSIGSNLIRGKMILILYQVIVFEISFQ